MDNLTEIRPGRFISITTHQNHGSDATIFLFHGLGGNKNQWREQVNVLKENYSLIIPDLLGHGTSTKPKPTHHYNPYTFTELEADLEAIFQKYATRNNIVIGHSYGGALSTA